MAYFTDMFDEWFNGSIFLYIAIYFVCIGLGFLAQSKTNRSRYKINGLAFVACFLILWFFYVFTKTGNDVQNYIAIYAESSFDRKWLWGEGLEPGYRLINAALHAVIENPYIGLGIIKSMCIGLIFWCIYGMRNQISVGYSIMAYVSLFYFDSYNLIRIHLAAAICLFGFLLLWKNKKALSFVFACLAVTIHTGAMLFVAVYFVYLIYSKGKYAKPFWKILIIVSVVFIAFGGIKIAEELLSSGFFYERYGTYMQGGTSIGIMIPVKFLPVFVLLFISYRQILYKMGNIGDLFFIFTIYSFAVALAGYQIGMLSRLSVILMEPFVVYIPFYMKNREMFRSSRSGRYLSRGTIDLIFFAYYTLWFLITMSGLLATSGLENYTFCFSEMQGT